MQIGTLELSGELLLAPLAGVTQAPFRLLCRELGAAFSYTELISADGLVRGQGESRLKTFRLLQSFPGERPFGVQIFGSDPAILSEAARIVSALDADLVDLNFGCPDRKVIARGAGAALMRDLQKAEAVFRVVRQATPLPLTVKMRSGWDQGSINAPEIARAAEAEGLDAVTVHARTGRQGFKGSADWQVIRRVVEAVKLPVIGNGDVASAEDVRRMREETGCAAVMIGRAVRGNPWIFRILQGGPEPTLEERRQTALRHLRMMEELGGPEQAVREMRLHLAWYCKGLPAATAIRRRLNSIKDIAVLRETIEQGFQVDPAEVRKKPGVLI
jgi:tRNA-dihydrouridine synthase B